MFLILFSLLAGAQSYTPTDESNYLSKYTLPVSPNGQIGLGEFSKPPRLSYDTLKNAKLNSYDDFLKYLNVQVPDIFEQSVLMHTSGSLQYSTKTHPRVLLYGDNIVLALSENPSTKDRRIEMLEFDDQSSKISMHEIIFKADQPVQFRKNPTECLSCHGQPARPLWEAYDFWPNAYGSRDGMFLSQQEEDHFSSISKEGVYSYLPKDVESNKRAIENFTVYISQINFLRWFKSMESSFKSELYPYRYYLLGLFTCISDFGTSIEDKLIYKDYIPEALRNSFFISFDSVFSDVVKSNKRTKNYLESLYHNIFKIGDLNISLPLDRLKDAEISIGSQMEWLFSNYGLYFRDSLMSMRQDNHILSTPTAFRIDLQKVYLRLLPELIKENDFTLEQFSGIDISYHKFNCDQLEEKSKKSLSQVAYNHRASFLSALKVNARQPIFGKCLSCHVVGRAKEKAPYIPFDESLSFGKKLRQGLFSKIVDRLNRKDHLRMPKGLPMSEKEKKSLIESLKAIKNLE